MPNAVASHGTIAAPSPLSSPSRENRMYVGIISSCVGIMIVATIAKNPTLRPTEPQPREPVARERAQHEVRDDRDDRDDQRC